MEYNNNKKKKLIEERDAIVSKFNKEINDEIQKEKSNYKFRWDRFSLMILTVVFIVIEIEVNEKIFPNSSIWSWNYYLNK